MSDVMYANLVTKEATSFQSLFAKWVAAETGYDVDVKTAELCGALYGRFQRSDANTERRLAERASRAEESAEKKAAREERRANRPPTLSPEQKAQLALARAERIQKRLDAANEIAKKAAERAEKAQAKRDKAAAQLAQVAGEAGDLTTETVATHEPIFAASEEPIAANF